MSGPEPWVGAWRPHKPRGPIAAFYSSPGPKYALPPALGINYHDPRKEKAPAYSFGIRHALANTDCSPGPGHLVPSNVTRVGNDGHPAYSIYGRPRDLQPFLTPGPGRYFPEKTGKMTFYSAPAYSLAARTKMLQSDRTPGPAAYMLPPVLGPHTVYKTSAPNFTLSARSNIGSFHEDLKKTPGPGTYKVVDPNIYKLKSAQYSIAGRNTLPGESTTKPGPGAHHPEQVTLTKVKAPSYSFGVHHSEYTAPLILETN